MSRPHARLAGALMALALSSALGSALGDGPGTRAIVLGVAQDGGMPHIGCRQEPCLRARREPALRQRVACLGLVDGESGERFLVDATPDFASQLESLVELAPARPAPRERPLDGILLTHAHVGHYLGLAQLGREALGARGVPVFATPRMTRFLRENAPWSQLVSLGQITLREIEAGQEVALTPRLRVTALRVPHRDELSDTVGFLVKGPSRSLLYVPDIDKWERWERSLAGEVSRVDHALLDATFLDAAEVPGRSLDEIPHPLVPETLRLLSVVPGLLERTLLTHLNHTNALFWDEARRRALAPARVALDGQELPL
ncbi:MAG: MBL fold metallo-hydrolase [Vicinamibacteria bacterium]